MEFREILLSVQRISDKRRLGEKAEAVPHGNAAVLPEII